MELSTMRRASALVLPLAFALLWFTSLAPSVKQDPGPVLVPFLVREVFEPVPAAAQLLVANRAEDGETVELLELEVSTRDGVLERLPLSEVLAADPDYVEVCAERELMPFEIAHNHSLLRWFAPQSAEQYSGAAAREALQAYQRKVVELAERYADPSARPYAALNHVLPYDQLFDGSEAPGTAAVVTWTVRWRAGAGPVRRSSVSQVVVFRGSRPGLPGQLAGSSLSLHRGDLHVHSCHGEALGACAPSGNCAAESFQTSGSFSYAQLKSQYQVLGLDWFTATDHSYCINDTAEYDVIAAEAAAITDSSFVCLADIELSSDEVGSQSGSDLGDLLCFGLTSANHMGAHGLSSRIAGGSDGLLGFCGGLNDFTDNLTAVRDQGGYSIANHPAGSSFGWNSRDATVGQEGNGLHGVEIWNEASQSGQGGNVGAWVDWLLDGRVLYAYSGSDTHDEAYAFGANHALVEGPLTEASLEAALKAGRNFVSNGPTLVLEAELGGTVLQMGSQVALPSPVPASSIEVRAQVDMGLGSGTVQLFRGRVGDSSETLVGQSSSQSGSFTFSINDSLAGGRTYYRAYVENSNGSQTAYSNPVFLFEGSGDPLSYCFGVENSQGCTPYMTTQGVASASSGFGFWLGAEDVINQQFGIMVYAYQADFKPLGNGTLCLGGSLKRLPVTFSGGATGSPDCSGQLVVDFNSWIATGNDPGLTPGTTTFAQFWFRDPAAPSSTGLSNATQFLIYP